MGMWFRGTRGVRRMCKIACARAWPAVAAMVMAFAGPAVAAEGPVQDIVEMVLGDKRTRLYRTADGFIFRGMLCADTRLSGIGPVVKVLESMNVRDIGVLLDRIQDNVCKVIQGPVPQSEVKEFYPEVLPASAAMYQGMKVLGEWDCPLDGEPQRARTLRFQDLSGKLPVVIRIRVRDPGTVELWLAPFLKGPSGAELWLVRHAGAALKWRVAARCYSVRI